MADITLKLIWYRLGETYRKMAEASSTWYTELDFDSYVLDLLLLGWCAGACMLVLAANSLHKALGPAQRQPAQKVRDTGADVFASVSASEHETCRWFNTAVSWFYLHFYHSPLFLEEWVKSLNEQLTKLGGPVQNKFDAIQPGSFPPKIIDISCRTAMEDALLIHAHLESQDLLLTLFASQQTGEGVRLTNCIAHVLKLKGTVRLKAFVDRKDVKIRANFEGKPDIKVAVKSTNPYQDPSTLVDLGVVEQNVRNALALATTTYTITHLLMPGDLSMVPGREPEEEKPVRPGEMRVRASDAGWGMSAKDIALLNQRFTAQNLQNQMAQLASSIQQPPSQHQGAPVVQQVPPQSRPHPVHSVSVQKGPEHLQSISVQPVRHMPPLAEGGQPILQTSAPQLQQKSPAPGGSRGNESLFEPISSSQYQSAFTSPTPGGPPKPPRMVGDRRLLVKVIKGNALTSVSGGPVNAVCYVSTDEPVQSYTSSVVRSTSNPFWDEHFLFDITKQTREVKFEVYDKTRQNGAEEYVGESVIYIEDLKRTPSSRQILRLQASPGAFDYTTGTVTAEFLFMEPAEADILLNSMTPSVSQLSPRRRIEVSQVVTPGGTRVTTTTTTTQKPQYGRQEAGYNTPPNYIEKRLDTSGRPSPNPADASAECTVINGAESVTDTAIRELMDRSRRPRTPTKTSTLIITGVRRTIESSPTEESADSPLSSQTSPDRQVPRGLTPETDDLELVRPQEPGSPNLKKSRSLGGSLKKLFKRGRKSRSRAREGDTSRDSSLSRGSGRHPASRDGSLSRQTDQNRASSVS